MLLILLNSGVDLHLSTSTCLPPPVYFRLTPSTCLPPSIYLHLTVSGFLSSVPPLVRNNLPRPLPLPPPAPSNPRLLVITSLPSTSLPLPPLPHPASHHSKGSRKHVGLSDALVECRGERPSSLSVCERKQERGGGEGRGEGGGVGGRRVEPTWLLERSQPLVS